jgi:hypothetical protein
LSAIVEQAISGTIQRGGLFSRFILRFHQLLSSTLTYKTSPRSDKVQRISEALNKHGHGIVPFPHGNCCASLKRQSRLAKCFSDDSLTLQREKAGADLCGHCVFHDLERTHMQGIRMQLDQLEATVSRTGPTSVQGVRANKQCEKVRAIIKLHQARFESAQQNGQ